jgi:hypothetical protein
MMLILSEVYSSAPNHQFVADVRTNAVLVSAPASQIAAVERLIAGLDGAASPQAAQRERESKFRHPMYRPSEQPAKIVRPTP